MSELDRKLVRGSAWLALSFGGGQVVTFVVVAVLAHFVTPVGFGLVALASVAIVVATTLQESGLGLAVIRHRTDVERAAGTVFVFNVAAGIVLYWLTFAIAPLLADLFSQPRLTAVLRVLALVLVLRSFGVIPGAMIERELMFANRAKGELVGGIVQGLVAIPLAVAGAGVWSLVAGQLAGQCLQSALFWVFTPLRPSPRLFSFPLLRELGKFGRHMTAANLIALIDQNIDTLTVGRLVGAADVGFYNMAWRLANLPATGIGYIVGRVMFPAYATLQHDKTAFRHAFLTNVRRVALFSLPVGVGILLTAHPIVVGVFGDRWEPAVVPLQILSVFGVLRAFAGTTGPVIQAAGKPQLIVRLNLWQLAALCAGLFTLTPPFGINGAATAVTLAAAAVLVPAMWIALRTLELRLSELLANVERPALCSVPLAICLAALQLPTSGLDDGLELALLVLCGAAVYVASALVLARSEVRTITTAFRSRATPADEQSVLVVVAHPDDEVLGFAGVIARARAQGWRVRVAVVTNGDDRALGRVPLSFSGARPGWPARVSRLGIRRGKETIAAMALLGLRFTRDPRTSDVLLLGYPNYGLEQIARSEAPWEGDRTGLHRTYAAGGKWRPSNGDFSHLLRGRHSRLCAADLARDFDDLVELGRPTDVYTHAEFDGHPDHAEVHRQLVAALRRRGRPVTVHSTLIHPPGTRERMYESAQEWPNPGQDSVATPFERFTPHLDFMAPPGDDGTGWGPLGPPDELIEVPPSMLEADPARNLKLQAITRYVTQLDCRSRGASYHPSCGYLRAFVKRSEFFWTMHIGTQAHAGPTPIPQR